MDPAITLTGTVVAATCALLLPSAVRLAGSTLGWVVRFLANFARISGSRSSRPFRTALLLLTLGGLVVRPTSARAEVPPPSHRVELRDPTTIAGRATAPLLEGGPVHVVVPGDTLWAIARHALQARTGTTPSDAEVNRYWRQIYAANRQTVGPDPDLIFPGQSFVLPTE